MPFQVGLARPRALKGEDGLFHGVPVEMAIEAPAFCPGPLGHRAKDPHDFTQPLGRQRHPDHRVNHHRLAFCLRHWVEEDASNHGDHTEQRWYSWQYPFQEITVHDFVAVTTL